MGPPAVGCVRVCARCGGWLACYQHVATRALPTLALRLSTCAPLAAAATAAVERGG